MGATSASEQAVERALDWLASHQDADGRWNAGSRKDGEGSARDDGDFTLHCPPGEICAGDCFYYDADTATTGLALLAYLGAGYTHTDGSRHARTVARGLQFLVSTQKPDGAWEASFGKATSVTSLAVMSYLACGHLRGQPGPYREAIEKGVRFVVQSQKPNGLLVAASSHGPMYCHGISTLMLAEVAGMVPDDPLAAEVRAALATERLAVSSSSVLVRRWARLSRKG